MTNPAKQLDRDAAAGKFTPEEVRRMRGCDHTFTIQCVGPYPVVACFKCAHIGTKADLFRVASSV